MRKIFLSLIILLSFGLFGCEKKEPVLLGPAKVSYDSGTMKVIWTEDKGATSYVILINGAEIPVNTNSYDMSSYEPGEYKIRVRSLFGKKESNYSPEITVNILGNLIIYVKEYRIYVSSIENARYEYSLRVDHNKIEGNNTSGVINIPNEFQDRVINFEVDVYVNNALKYTARMEISLILNRAFKDKDLEILVDKPSAVHIDGKKINATLLKDRAIIPKEMVETLESEVILSVSGNTHVIKKLFVTDPIVELTSKQVIKESDELKFTFDLNGFTFINLAKEGFKLGTDYFFDEGVLTFSDEFIKKYKGLFPESKNIYLMAVFRRGTETVLINIMINLDA